MRIGVVDVQKIIEDGHVIKIAKLAISPTYDQAILAGSGIDYAEKLVKDRVQGHLYSLGDGKPLMEANYSGFTCRWEDIPSRYGETLSLIVKVTESMLETEVHHYSQIIETIRKIYGESHQHHPIHFDGLNLTFDPVSLSVEANAMTSNIFQRSVLLTKIFVENVIGKIATIRQKSFMGFSMSKHRQKMVLSSDYKKFDGSLKMIISGTTAQRLEFEDYLNKLVEKGILIYGIHVSDRALLTCLVFDGSGKEVHFVDSADGGYALAAKKIKAKIY